MSVASVSNNQYAYLEQDFHSGAYAAPQKTSSEMSDASEAMANDGTEKKEMALFGEDGFGFDDFLDIINPLQHLPVISNIYREITGDELSPGSRMIGGGVFGGGIGLAASVINTAIEAETGKDLGGHVIAMFTGDEEPAEANIAAVPDTKPEAKAATVPQPAIPAAPADSQQQPVLSLVKETKTDSPIQNVSAPEQINDVQARSAAHMGLEWKGQTPDPSKNIKNIQALQGKNLTDEQMSLIFNSFKSANPKITATPPAPQPTPQQATSQYEKQVKATNVSDRDVSSAYDYLERVI